MRQFSELQQSRGQQAWLAPAILEWETWVSQLWERFRIVKNSSLFALGKLQEHAIWEEVIRNSEEGALLLRHASMASLAQKAYALLSDYNQHAQRHTPWEDGDPRAFQLWAEEFDRQCEENQWISRSMIPYQLAAQLPVNPGELLLVGFDRLKPSMKYLLNAWTSAGGSWSQFDQDIPPRTKQFFVASDFREEATACASWLRKKLEENPKSRLAVVVPDGHGTRGELERIFRRTLAPQALLLREEGNAALPFEFSLGVPLSSVEEVRGALMLLDWLVRPLPEQELRWLLSSGLLAKDQEEGRNLIHAYHRLRRTNLVREEWTLDAFLHDPKIEKSKPLESLLQRLKQFRTKADTATATQMPMNWILHCTQLLQLAGWPGNVPFDSSHYQMRKKWDQLLREVATLGLHQRSLYFQEFLAVLNNQATDTVFAEESHGAPIQVIGPFETSGQTFSAIWFMGAAEQLWPPKANPNPLIPFAIAGPAKMPHTSADVDFELAKAATNRIATSAEELVFSYAKRNADGEIRPAPVVKALFRAEAEPLQKDTDTATEWPPLEDFAEDEPIPFPAERVAGGADVLRRQSACPFQAFAAVRLGARSIDDSEMGLNPAQRGTLLHHALEIIWKQLRSQEALLEQKENGTLEDTIEEAILRTLAEHTATQNRESWRTAYLSVEQRRMKRLLMDWLSFEATRIPFHDVRVEEEKKEVSIGKLRLSMRIDRLDSIGNNKKLLIDYKTGRVNPKSWDGERPEDPQLPLYALYGNLGDIRGLLFAQLRTGEMELKGRAEEAEQTVHPEISSRKELKKNPLTDQMREDWKAQIDRLAEGFLKGELHVDPKNPLKTCQNCDLASLCRRSETDLALRAAAMEPTEDTDDQNGN